MAQWMVRKVRRRCKFKRRAKTILILSEEIYLRDDIRCGSPLCNSCIPHLSRLPLNASHYLLPNAEAILQFWEVLELPQLTGVVFLTSVLKELQEKLNQRSWRRLRTLFTDQRRANFFFDDEHCLYTWLSRSSNDEASTYLRDVAEWFVNHLEGAVSLVVLTGLTGDKSLPADFEKLTLHSGNVKVLDPESYFRLYWSHESAVHDLFSSLALSISEAKETGNETRKVSGFAGGKSTYKEHLSARLLEDGVASGAFRAGTFFVSRHAPSEALVRPSNKGEASRLEIFVPGRELQNRALHGDIVAVRLISNSSLNAMKEEADPLDDVLPQTGGHLSGEVVGILQRVQRDYVACLSEEDEAVLSTGSRLERLRCIPMDRRIPLVELGTRQGERLLNQRFIVRIDRWPSEARFPAGHLVRSLGSIGDLSAEMHAILIENGISVAPFSNLALQELPEDTLEKPWCIPQREYELRRDIRFSHRSCSIDPPGSKDVDDVLSVRHLENGLLEVGVHIADVSYFVKEGSILDLEARSRGTTVYMVGKSWNMLPPVLSENLCSLVGGKDRFAVSVIWTIDSRKNFEVVKTWFGRTVIRSRHQLFYAQAEAIMEGKHLPPGWEIDGDDSELAQLQSDLTILGAFAQNRRTTRRLNGALELASSELRFQMNEKKEPVQVETKTELPMNWIVAEMMIFANACVGEKIYRTFPNCALLRKHAAPKIDNFTMLLECSEAQGLSLDASSNKNLAASLDRVREHGNPVVERAFRALVTRAMSEAEYFSTGEEEVSQFYHYGLALAFYTHFTSPIRRYADILVHRALLAACELPSDSETTRLTIVSSELQEVAEHLNEKHRASKRAQKECNELYLLMYLQRQVKAECGVVIGLASRGITVFVPKYDLRGLVMLEDKNGEYIPPEEHASDPKEPKKCTILKQKTSIKIMEPGTGMEIREYKLMDMVWVRLRADGSRAHGPALRMDLLSDNHPAVLAAKAEGDFSARASDETLKWSVKAETLKPSWDASSERMKAIRAMADIVAADSTNTQDHSKTRKQLAVADVLHNVLEAKASSLFQHEKAEDCNFIAAALGSSNSGDVVMSSSSESDATSVLAVDEESQNELLLRREWEQYLANAGAFRAKLTTSTSSNASDRQQERARRELQARANANSLQMQLC